MLSRGEHVVPIPGTKRRSYLEENVAAGEIALSPEDSEQIAAAIPTPAGERYDEHGMRTVNL